MSKTSSPAGAAPSTKPAKSKRRLLLIVGGIVVLLLVLLLLTPTLLSSGAGAKFIASRVNATIPGKVSFDSLSLGWFSGQHVRGFKLLDPEGREVIVANQVDLPNASLAKLLRGNLNIGVVSIIAPKITLRTDEKGLNLTRAVSNPDEPKTDEPAKLPESLRARVEIAQGYVSYEAQGVEKSEVKNLAVSADATNLQDIALVLHGDLAQGNATGRVELEGGIKDLVGAGGLLQPDKATLTQGVVKLINLPIDAVDGVAQLDGKLTAVLGKLLTADAKIQGNLTAGTASIETRSENMQARGDLAIADKQLVTPQGKEIGIDLKLRKEAWPVLTRGSRSPSTLKQDVNISLHINGIKAGMDTAADSPLKWTTSAFHVRGTASDILIDAGGDLGTVALRKSDLRLDTDNLSESFQGGLAAVAEKLGQQPGSIKIDGNSRNLFGSDGRISPNMAAVINVQIKDTPLAIVDQLSRTEGKITEWLGQILNAEAHFALKPADEAGSGNKGLEGTVTLKAHSENLEASFTAPITTDQVALVKDPISGRTGSIVLKLPRAVLNRQLADSSKPADQQVTIAQDAVLTLDVQRLTIPVKPSGGGLDLAAAKLTVLGTLPTLAANDPTIGPVTLSDIRLDLSSEGLAGGLTGRFMADSFAKGTQGKVDINSIAVRDLIDAQGMVDFASATTTLKGTIKGLSTAIIDTYAKQDGLVAGLLGPTIDSELNATIKLGSPEKGDRYVSFDLNPSSANLKSTRLAGEIKNNALTLKPETAATLTMSQKSFDDLLAALSADKAAPTLRIKAPATLNLAVRGLEKSLDEKGELRHADVELRVDQFLPIGEALAGTQPELRDLVFTCKGESMDQPLQVTLSSKLSESGHNGSIQGSAKILNAMEPSRRVEDGRITGKDLPVGLVDALLGQGGKIVKTLGKSLDNVDVTIQSDAAGTMLVKGNLKSSQTTGSFDAAYTAGDEAAKRDMRLVLNPSTFSLALTEEARQAWMAGNPAVAKASAGGEKSGRKSGANSGEKSGGMTLAEPLRLKLDIAGGELVLVNGAKDAKTGQVSSIIDPSRSKLNATLSSPGAVLRDSTHGRTVRLRDFAARIDTPASLAERLNVELNSRFSVTEPNQTESDQGELHATISAAGLKGSDGAIDAQRASYDIAAEGKAIPVDALDALMEAKGQYVQILGHKANLKLTTTRRNDRPGPAELIIDSENLKGTIPGQLAPNWVLTLTNDSVLTMRVTRELSSGLLSTVSMLVRDARSDEKPAKLTIAKQNFSVKTYPFDINTLNADATLELNRLIVSSGGKAGGIIQTLQKLGSNIESREEFPADFTVAKIEIRNGRITTNDIWFTTDRRDLTMGTKAVAYQVKDPNTGEMVWYSDTVLGISGDTVTTIKSLAGYIDPASVIELNAKGKAGEVVPDYGAFASQIGFLVAKAQSERALGNKGGGAASIGIDLGSKLLKGLDKNKDKNAPTMVISGWPNKPRPVEREAEQTAAPPEQGQADESKAAAQQQPSEAKEPPPQREEDRAIDAVEGLLRDLGKKKKK